MNAIIKESRALTFEMRADTLETVSAGYQGDR